MSSGPEQLTGTTERDDAQLLRAYVSGDEQAFEALVKRYFGLVHAVALRRVQDPSLAEEATQSTFIILAHKAKSLSKGVLLRGWLLKTARFVCNDALKSLRRRQAHAEALELYFSELTESNGDCAEVRELLEQALLSLPPIDQACLVARFYEGQSFKEIGDVLGMTEDGAQKKVSRSLKKLRRYLIKRGTKTSDVVLSGLLGACRVPPAPVEVVQSSLRVILGSARGKLSSGLAVTLAGRCLRLLARREWAMLATRVVLSLLLVASAGWVSWLWYQGLGPNAGGLKPGDPQIDALGKAWSLVVLRAAAAKQTFRTAPVPNTPQYQAYMNELQFAVNETTRIQTQLQSVLKPAEERKQMAEFLTVELRETLGLNGAQQIKLCLRAGRTFQRSHFKRSDEGHGEIDFGRSRRNQGLTGSPTAETL